MTQSLATTGVLHEEEFKLTQSESGMASRDIAPDTLNRDQWQDLWRFQVPIGNALIFQSHHIFSLFATYVVDGLDLALYDDGGVFTDDTTDANDAGAGDVDLIPATEAENDAFYIGHHAPFGQVGFDLGTAGVGTTGVWEYYNGSAYATVPGTTDGTTLLTASGVLTFQPPSDWARVAVDGKEAYYIRFRVTASPDYTTQPVADQMWINGTAAGAAMSGVGAYERFRLEVRDAAENQRYPIMSNMRYNQLTAFRDRTLRFYLPLNEPVVAKEQYWVVIQARPAGGTIDVSASYFELTCKRVRKGIYQ